MSKKNLLMLTNDQQHSFDYAQSYEQAMSSLGGNSGNNVFQYSLQKLLRYDGFVSSAEMYDNNKLCAELGEKYDNLILAPANALALYMVQSGQLNQLTDIVKNVRKPVHLIGLGAQSTYDFSDDFLSVCREPARRFIAAVLESGGKISVRGYFTQEIIQKLGFRAEDCEVTGCPSIYINGGNLKVHKAEIRPQELIPAINGTPVWNHPQVQKYFAQYPKSFFVDQDKFYRLLYHPETLGRKELKHLANKKKSWVEMYLQDRIRFYGDYACWVSDLKRQKVNFSFGSRIHGNILPILQGIPAFITATDSRVREMAAFFHIPTCQLTADLPQDLYEFYEKTDYSKFNQEFATKYQNFAKFMESCGLEIKPQVKQEFAIDEHLVPMPDEKAKALILHQAKICRRSKLHFILYAFWRYLLRGFQKHEWRF